MRLERHGGFFIGFLLAIWVVGNITHYAIDVLAPNEELFKKAKRENKQFETLRNDSGLYAEVLELIKTCNVNVEKKTGNKFYICPNGEKITQINWERDQKTRVGVVTRYYDNKGNLRLIYGHPDD